MLETLITSKTRIKLLLRLFLTPDSKGYLRGLADEFNESSNAVRVELNRLEDAGMLKSVEEGNKKYFLANTDHPLYDDISRLLRKITGLDELIERVVQRLGGVEEVWLVGEAAQGKQTERMEVALVGGDIDVPYLNQLLEKAETVIKKKITYTLFNKGFYKTEGPAILVWRALNLTT